MSYALYALAQRGEDMTPLETKAYSLNNILGGALLLFGALFCYLRVVASIKHVSFYFPSNASDVLGLLPATGLAAARLLQDLTLNPASAFSAALYFLLSCWPVVIIFLGAILLRNSLFAALQPESSRIPHVGGSSGDRE